MVSYFNEYTISRTAPKREACERDALGNYVYKCVGASRHLTRVAPAPFNTETFWARVLLLQPGCTATSWEALRTVGGTVHATYAAAASELGLAQDESTARLVLEDAITSSLTTPSRARVLLLQVRPALTPCMDWLSTCALPSRKCTTRTRNRVTVLCWQPDACC